MNPAKALIDVKFPPRCLDQTLNRYQITLRCLHLFSNNGLNFWRWKPFELGGRRWMAIVQTRVWGYVLTSFHSFVSLFIHSDICFWREASAVSLLICEIKMCCHSSFSVNRSFCQICQNCIREKMKDWDFNDPYIAMLYWFQLNPLSSSKSKKSIEHDYIMIIKVSVFQAMGPSTGVRHERQEMISTVLGSRVQLLLEVTVLLIFFL